MMAQNEQTTGELSTLEQQSPGRLDFYVTSQCAGYTDIEAGYRFPSL